MARCVWEHGRMLRGLLGQHFDELYMRTGGFDESALECIPQHEVDEEGGREGSYQLPGEKEVEQAVQRQVECFVTGMLGGEGSAAAVKVKEAASTDAEVRGALVRVVGGFWESEVRSSSRVGGWALEDPSEIGGSEQSWEL